MRRKGRAGAMFLCAIVATTTFTGCAVEYHGYPSGIDGVLWRQVASFEDPLSQRLYSPPVDGPTAYLDTLPGARWDGDALSAAEFEIEQGGIVLYNISSTDAFAHVSVFIASGPRPAIPTDDGYAYNGPSEVYTCYDVRADFRSQPMPSAKRDILTKCPTPLVELLAEDAAFASGEVFDG